MESQGPDSYLLSALINKTIINEIKYGQKRATKKLWIKELTNIKLANKQIGDFLHDCKKFSGIGNYLRCEILYECKISPFRKLSELSLDEIENLYKVSLKIILSNLISMED